MVSWTQAGSSMAPWTAPGSSFLEPGHPRPAEGCCLSSHCYDGSVLGSGLWFLLGSQTDSHMLSRAVPLMELTKGLHPKYVKNSYKSIRKTGTTNLQNGQEYERYMKGDRSKWPMAP